MQYDSICSNTFITKSNNIQLKYIKQTRRTADLGASSLAHSNQVLPVWHQTQNRKGQIRAVGGSNVAMPHKNTIQLNEVNSQSQLQHKCVSVCVLGNLCNGYSPCHLFNLPAFRWKALNRICACVCGPPQSAHRSVEVPFPQMIDLRREVKGLVVIQMQTNTHPSSLVQSMGHGGRWRFRYIYSSFVFFRRSELPGDQQSAASV